MTASLKKAWKTELRGNAAYVSIYHPIGLPSETGWAHFAIQPYSDTSAARANAELIVRAVNSHQALVEALDTMLDHYTALVNSGDCGNWDPEAEKEVQQVRAALKLAKGDLTWR